jgi:phosphoesterase RecJ-like protein
VTDLLAVPPARRDAIERLATHLRSGQRVAISTHVNADGDGCGSEAGLARLLGAMGMDVRIVNPTPWPASFAFLLGDDVTDRTAHGADALRDIEVLIVLDINDVGRLGQLADAVRALKVPRLVIDHHVAQAEPAGDDVLADTAACATGELIFDFATTLHLPITAKVAEALYVALLTDTGGFRFANTSPRCHAVAGALLAAGVNPETMYRRVYASIPVGRVHLLREALESLGVDESRGLAWLSLTAGALERHGVSSEDLDGIVEHARSIAGTRLALFFRDLGYGKVKVSFRSTSEVDSNVFARRFGGGGHVRASGALIPGTLEGVRERVLGEARALADQRISL